MNTSFSTLRDFTQARLDILKQLRNAGIQQEIELPQIVAVGIQSVGKSSVMEAISTLKLPRGDGTVTKCPMEFRLEHTADSPSLSVDITLRLHGGVAEFKSNLSDLDEIRDAIAAAQDSIIRDSTAATAPGQGARTFSEDCVSVHAKGHKLPDLHFYDIPGVIEDVRDGQNPDQIDLIKSLVRKYVAKPNCIVLLIISCDYDLEVGGVARLIFTDPEIKSRTVGVLTKVDKISKPKRQSWLETFENKTRNLDNGWFAVKLPEEPDVSWEDARTQERDFFQENNPWKSIDGEGRNRLGSEQLTRYITKLLSNLVANRLPAISREITTKIVKCDAELKRLPIHTERDACKTVIAVVQKFSKDFSAHIIEGVSPKPFSDDVGMVFEIKGLYDTIRPKVSENTPRFCPTSAPINGAPAGSSSAWVHLCASGKIVYLDEVIKFIAKASKRELPGELPYAVTPELITCYVQDWQKAAIAVFDAVEAVAVEHLDALVQAHLTEYERGGLLTTVKEIVDVNRSDCATVTIARLEELAAMELVPATVLKSEYTVLQATIQKQYQAEIAPDPVHETSLMSCVARLATIVADVGTGDISSATLQALVEQFSSSDSEEGNSDNVPTLSEKDRKDHNNGLEVMASAQAYLELASKRFEEVVVNCIDHSFLREWNSRVCHALGELLPSTAPDLCLKLIQDPSVAARRESISEERLHYARVKAALDRARRDLERDARGRQDEGSQQNAPGLQQSEPNSEDSLSLLSADRSSPSVRDLD
ncbi:P-loop containing nucleoside triphosphate hydrolase protein, partial [Mycena polygramma]